MATLYVRNFPEELYRWLKETASERRRSLGAEVTVIVERAREEEGVTQRRLRALEEIARRRRSFKLPPGAQDSLSMLREDRER